LGAADRIPAAPESFGRGGGKGLRLVSDEKDLLPAFKLARSEALSSFADPAVYIERYIEEPHHIEIQILADNFGNVVYLGERECSMQRRYQKILEETPSPFLNEETRIAMGRVAVKAAASIGYRNAGTVEFVVDRNRNFYFLEVNARLQVEHPITEMVTGIDLVKCQLEIAAGRPCPSGRMRSGPRDMPWSAGSWRKIPSTTSCRHPGRSFIFTRPRVLEFATMAASMKDMRCP